MANFRELLLRANNLPPAPNQEHNAISVAMDDYEKLRGNYAAAISQLNEAHDIASQFAYANEALEETLKQERTFYREEINRLQRERDMLASFSARIRTRLDTINEVIRAAVNESEKAAMQIRPIAQEEDEDAEAAAVREIHDKIARINPPREIESKPELEPASDTSNHITMPEIDFSELLPSRSKEA